MKPGRQSVILDIITSQDVETQHQLIEALAERGVKSTQATLSRDIKDMRLVKELGPNGKYRYVQAARPEHDETHLRLRKILHESMVSCDFAQNLVIVKTLPGLAPAACSAIDGMDIDNLVGTLAGDDTAFIAMRDTDSAALLKKEIETYGKR